jgi:hypothetical protein
MTLYDRLDWHRDGAIAAGQPEENAFAHAGMYLSWLIRHDLHDPNLFAANHVEAVKRGEMTGSDLVDDIDGKLGAWLLTAEGVSFSDARYDAYLDELRKLFADVPDYGVVEDADNYRVVEGVLDRLYAEWVDAQRPAATPTPFPDVVPSVLTGVHVRLPPGFDESELQALLGPYGDMPVTVERHGERPGSHVAPELEALIPRDLTSPPMDVTSASAANWRSSKLNRALKLLDVRAKDAVVVTGLGGRGRETLLIAICVVPGVHAARLATVLEAVFPTPPDAARTERTIGDRVVVWTSTSAFELAYWARDGLAIGASGTQADIERAIRRLP